MRLGDRLIGFLEVGQVLQQQPSEKQFEGFVEKLAQVNGSLDTEYLQKLF